MPTDNQTTGYSRKQFNAARAQTGLTADNYEMLKRKQSSVLEFKYDQVIIE
jgi:hypothetical protein